MNRRTSNFILRKEFSLFAIFFLIILFSCKKDGKLSPDFDNGNLSILFTDTFSLKTTVIKEDSIRTDLSVYNLLGIYNDPIFGPVSSSIYAQVTLTGLNVDFDSPTSTLDSIVLTLDYIELYGNSGGLAPIKTPGPLGIAGNSPTSMSVNVYELSNDLSSSTDYYSNSYVAHGVTLLGSSTFTPNLTDSVDIGFDTIIYKPHLRIKLSNTFGQNLMNADADGSNMMTDNSTFTSFMKGLYITTVDSVSNTSLAPGTGSILSFNMNSSMSTLTIYYNDTSSYDFTINTDGVKFSRFAHDYTGTDVEAHLNQLSTRDTTITYLSTMAGVKTKIEIPNIKDITQNGTVVINKAELVLTVESGTEGNFDEALSSISLVGVDANGDAFFLPDFFEGIDYYGGTIDESARTYTFNISRHITDLIYNTTTDYGMYLIANGASISANRVVLGSDKNVISAMRLNITYSKL